MSLNWSLSLFIFLTFFKAVISPGVFRFFFSNTTFFSLLFVPFSTSLAVSSPCFSHRLSLSPSLSLNLRAFLSLSPSPRAPFGTFHTEAAIGCKEQPLSWLSFFTQNQISRCNAEVWAFTKPASVAETEAWCVTQRRQRPVRVECWSCFF